MMPACVGHFKLIDRVFLLLLLLRQRTFLDGNSGDGAWYFAVGAYHWHSPNQFPGPITASWVHMVSFVEFNAILPVEQVHGVILEE